MKLRSAEAKPRVNTARATRLNSQLCAELTAARTTEAFTAACRKRLQESSSVNYHPEALEQMRAEVAATEPASWTWQLPEELRGPKAPLSAVLREFAFNAALNGGYFKMEDGQITQWETKGSGSQALLEWIEKLRQDKILPGVDLKGRADAKAAIEPRVQGLPMAKERLETCAEFSDPKCLAALTNMAGEIAQSCANGETVTLTLEHADRLARAFPAGFGDDPFRKKALLALLYMAGFLRWRGQKVSANFPIPADYQIPRIFAWRKAITLSPGMTSALRMSQLLDADSALVEDVRAAAVVAGSDLAELAGVDPFVVDNALFIKTRKNPEFLAQAPPPMRCDSFRF